jgi:hypothetical protein
MRITSLNILVVVMFIERVVIVKIRLILAASILLLSGQVNASIIIDTETGFGAGPVLNDSQYYGGLFTLS